MTDGDTRLYALAPIVALGAVAALPSVSDSATWAVLHGQPSLRWGALTYLLAPLLGAVHGFTAAAVTLPLRDRVARATTRSTRRASGRTHLLRGTGLGVVNLVLVVGLWDVVPHGLLDAAQSVGLTFSWIVVQVLAAAVLCLGWAVWRSRDEPSPSNVARWARATAGYGVGLVVLVAVAAVASL